MLSYSLSALRRLGLISLYDQESDVRGVDTVQIAMYCHGPRPLMRWLYFSLRDGGEELRSRPPEFSRIISENWQEKLIDIMETGQSKCAISLSWMLS